MKEYLLNNLIILAVLIIVLIIYCIPEVFYGFILGLMTYSLIDALIKKDL